MFSENETCVVESKEKSVLQRKLALNCVRGPSYGDMEVVNFKVFSAIEVRLSIGCLGRTPSS